MATKLASVKDLSEGKMIGIEEAGRNVLVAKVNGKYYAIGNTCTHEGCTLSEGMLRGERVECPCHGSTFKVTTGEVVRGPAEKPEPTYQVKVENDEIVLLD